MNSKKPFITLAVLLITLLTSSVTYATLAPLTPPPPGGYDSGSNSILDPGCLPNAVDCVVNLSSGGSITADNGLTVTGSNVQLGGTLLQDTVIDQDGKDLTFNTITSGSRDSVINHNEQGFNVMNGKPLLGSDYNFFSVNDSGISGFASDLSEYTSSFSFEPGYLHFNTGSLIDAYSNLNMDIYTSSLEVGSSPFRSGYSIKDSKTDLYTVMNANGDEVHLLTDQNGITFQFKDGLTSIISSYLFPKTDGTANQVLITDGAGQLSWQNGGGGSGWLLTGNSGTTAGTNFIGTTDAQDFVVKTNSNELMRMTASGNIGIGTNNPLFGFHVQDTSIAMTQSYSSGNSANLFMFDNTLMPGVEGLGYKREWDSGNKAIEFDLSNIDLSKGYISMSATDNLTSDSTGLGIFPDLFRVKTETTTPSNKLFSILSDLRTPYTLWQDGSFAYNDDNFQNDTPGTEQNMFYFNYGNHDGLGGINTKRAIRLGSALNDEWDASSLNVGDRSIAIGFATYDDGYAGPIASEYGAIALGQNNVASGQYSVAFGFGTIASENTATAFGSGTIASGGVATAFGSNNYARSLSETAFGSNGTDYTPINFFSFNGGDRLVNIGNGINNSDQSDAFTILKNGQTGIGIDNFETNTNGNIFQVGDGATGIIGYVDNGTGNWVAVSDERKKDNITDLTYGLNELIQLRPTSFNYKRNNEHTIGFLAQQVLPIIPEAVYGTESEGYGMSYATLTPVIVKAIQELNLKVDLLSLNTGTTSISVFDGLKGWLADTANGIENFVAGTIKARTQVCIDDVCVNKQQLQQILQNNGINQSAPIVNTPPPTDPGPTPSPSDDPSIDTGDTPTDPSVPPTDSPLTSGDSSGGDTGSAPTTE